MDHRSSDPTTLFTNVYDFDGSDMMKQEPQNDFPQMEFVNDSGLSENVNIAPILGSQLKICKTEGFPSIKQEHHSEWCELSKTSHQPAFKRETVKRENDLNVCDNNQDSKLFNRDVTLKTEIVRNDDSSGPLVEVSGAIDCKDGIISNVTTGIYVGRVNQSVEEQSYAAEQQRPCHLKGINEIKREGM